MAVLKAIVSLYRAGEEKPIERYKTRVKVAEENTLFSSFQKNIIEFLGFNEQAQKFGLGSFDLKFYRLTKINGKAENYAITTQQQLELELPFLLSSDGESGLYVCIQLLRFAIFRSCCQQAHGNNFAIASQEPTMLWSFVISV